MAIKIPSSKIYEMQNPKVRDNVIERIEVGAVEVLPNNKSEEVVYTNTISGFTKDEGSNSIIGRKDYLVNMYNNEFVAVDYVELVKEETRYTKGQIVIPIHKDNFYISKIVAKEGNNFQYTIKGKTTTKDCNATVTAHSQSYVSRGEITYSNAKSKSEIIEFPKMPISILSRSLIGIKLNGKLKNDTNVNLSLSKDNNNYYLDYSILWYYLTEYLKGYTLLGDTFEAKGKHEEYIAEQIEITVYGKTIGIDLQNKTLYINGETAKKVHSIDGNELMQTTNYTIGGGEEIIVEVGGELGQAVGNSKCELFYDGLLNVGQELWLNGEKGTIQELKTEDENYYTIMFPSSGEWASSIGKSVIVKLNGTLEDIFTKIKEKYQNGKETATIRCSIADYYDYNTNEVAISDKFVNVPYTHNTTSLLQKTEYIYLEKAYPVDIIINYVIGGAEKGQKIIPKGSTFTIITHSKTTSFKIVSVGWVKMAFAQYDKVIPMVYGADGVDRPMSLKLDGSPKVFTVLGTKIFYDGAIFQEISLQEA